MKQSQSIKFTAVSIMLKILITLSLQNDLIAQSVTVAGIEYQIIDGTWYNYG